MRKREQEELRRLEEALLESEYDEDFPEEEVDLLEDTWLETADVDYQVYNTDDTDVDLKDYSEEVYREESRGGLPVVVVVFTCLLLAAVILGMLRFMGVLG